MSEIGMFSSRLKATTKLVPLPTPAEVRAFLCHVSKPTGAHLQSGTGLGGRELEADLEDVKMSKEK